MNNSTESLSKNVDRRSFIIKLLWAAGGIMTALISIPVVGALIAPLLRKQGPGPWRDVGKMDDFKIGETILVRFKDPSPLPWSGNTDRTASWLRRNSKDEFIAFSVNCPHLGCPVRWIADAEIFLCPCHGGVFNKDGSYAAGPPPHDLTRYPVRINNGQVEIQSSPIPITTF